MFQVPSSSPPTTPESQKKTSRNLFSPSHPSTTPLGPPPRSSFTNVSTTPAGPPPSSVLGSNGFNSRLQASTPPRYNRNGARGSPLKFASSRRNDGDDDMMDEDRDTDNFAISVQGQEEGMGQDLEALDVYSIARSLVTRPAPLRETGDIILKSMMIVDELHAAHHDTSGADSELDAKGADVVRRLLHLWTQQDDPRAQTMGIGPGNASADFSKAVFVASLLLVVHHAGQLKNHQGPFRTSRSSKRKSVPEAMFEWLRDFHNPYADEYSQVMNHQDGPAAAEQFWDVVYSQGVRGDLQHVINLLREADFAHAPTALDDGSDEPGYEGQQLANIQRVVNRAVSTFETCPGLVSDDWDMRGTDWAIFRKRIHQARSEMETFAEGSILDRPEDNYGYSRSQYSEFSVSRMSQRAQSKVPWTVYENLKQLYSQLMGSYDEVLSACGDWLEATIAITAWWDGNDETVHKRSLTGHQKSLGRSQHTRAVDVRPVSAYTDKLMATFRRVTSTTDEAELQVNTTDPVEIALGCIFERDMDGLLKLLKGWSAVVANTVVELAELGQWLNAMPTARKDLMGEFDKSDLMVLSLAKPDEASVDYDQELVGYSKLLASRGQIRCRQPVQEIEGWELAVQVLSKARDDTLMAEEITKIIDGLELNQYRADRAAVMCGELQLIEAAQKTSERFANQLAEKSNDYGDALVYFARAHLIDRVRHVLDVLISSCLVQSRAFPPAASLDRQLALMIEDPGRFLTELRSVDGQAAEILANQLSGYATLIRFYSLRDMEVYRDQNVTQPKVSKVLRKKAAADALVSVITSAADSIHGGLYDDSIRSVIPVEGLIVLLGEALPFVNQRSRLLSTQQIFALLKAVEDVSTVAPSVYSECEACFRSALAAAKGAPLPSPHSLLKQSSTNMSGSSSQFSLINAAMSESQSNGMGEDSGVLVRADSNTDESKTQRAWDWRNGLERSAKAGDVLQILRLGLAREVSRTWTGVDIG